MTDQTPEVIMADLEAFRDLLGPDCHRFHILRDRSGYAVIAHDDGLMVWLMESSLARLPYDEVAMLLRAVVAAVQAGKVGKASAHVRYTEQGIRASIIPHSSTHSRR